MLTRLDIPKASCRIAMLKVVSLVVLSGEAWGRTEQNGRKKAGQKGILHIPCTEPQKCLEPTFFKSSQNYRHATRLQGFQVPCQSLVPKFRVNHCIQGKHHFHRDRSAELQVFKNTSRQVRRAHGKQTH